MPIDLVKIERCRIRLGLTQAEIASKAGMSKQAWNNVIKGRNPNISLAMVERIAKSLGVPVADLLIV